MDVGKIGIQPKMDIGAGSKNMDETGAAASSLDRASIGDSSFQKQVDPSMISLAPRGRATEPELRKEIERLYEFINEDNDKFDEKFQAWEKIVEKTRDYLSMPESFSQGGFGPLARFSTNDPGIQFVSLSAPRPHIAGTMAQNWNFIQRKESDGAVHIQVLGEEDPDLYTDGRVWQRDGRDFMTALGYGKADSRHIYPFISVFEKSGCEWKPCKNMFESNVTHIEGHELSLTPDGALYVANDFAAGDTLEMDFTGNGCDVKITGKKESRAILKDGRYVICSWEEEEKRRKMKKDLEMLKKMRESAGKVKEESLITAGDKEVIIAGVKLPVREY